MMKLILTEHEDQSEVEVMDGCLRLHAYTFDDHKQARAFCQGFQCAKTVANGMIQSLPMSYESRKSPAQPETIGQQLSKQWVGRA